MTNISVSQLLVRYMERLGIETIFGMPGAHILPVYDSLYDSRINSILVKHEQGAAFMASGYARASGKIAACISTAGPGATNLVTGIANAYVDKQPVLAITGETSTHIFGRGGLQESSGEGGSIDQHLLFRGITSYARLIERTDYLVNVLNRASNVLLSSNPGPVLLSFPFNVQKETVDAAILDDIKTARNPATHPATDNTVTIRPMTQAIESLTRLIAEAKHPIIIAGYGCIQSGGQDAVTALSKRMRIPVATSLKGKGAVHEQSDYALGSMGVTSYGNARRYITETADLLIVLGAGFNERTSYLWESELLKDKKIAQVDINEAQLEKVFRADVAIQGDIKQVVTDVLQNIEANNYAAKNNANILETLDELKTDIGADATTFNERFTLVKHFYDELARAFPKNIQVFDDNIIFAQNFFRVSTANRYHPNSGVSSLGYAIPAAIGARFAHARPTFAILGDGGFQMCCMEIMTAVNYNIPINIIMFNNSTMGLIRKNQFQQYNKRFINCDFNNPDFAGLARAFGIKHRRIENERDVTELFTSMDFHHDINLIEIMLDKDAFPNYFTRR